MTPPKRRRKGLSSAPPTADALGPIPRRTDWWAVGPLEWLGSAKGHGGRRRLLAIALGVFLAVVVIAGTVWLS
jgi:hypothetical protein